VIKNVSILNSGKKFEASRYKPEEIITSWNKVTITIAAKEYELIQLTTQENVQATYRVIQIIAIIKVITAVFLI